MSADNVRVMTVKGAAALARQGLFPTRDALIAESVNLDEALSRVVY
jgi:hypothetical protein